MLGDINMAAIYNLKNKKTGQYVKQVDDKGELVEGAFDLQWINLYMTLC